MRILITGACGFIGRHVWRLLEAKGHELVGIDALVEQVHGVDAASSRPAPGSGRLYYIKVGPLAAVGSGSWQPLIGDVDAVIHLAAEVGVAQSQYEPARYVQANVLETAQLWERIIEHRDRIKTVVVASSMSLYGEGEYTDVLGHTPPQRYGSGLRRAVDRGWDAFDYVWPDGHRVPMGALTPLPTRECKTPEPASVYALSKWNTEQYSLLLGQTYGVATAALRFFNTYGDGQSLSNGYTGALATFACRVLNGRSPLVYEDGQQTRDFIHVDDVARAVVAAVEARELTGAYNVGTGVSTSLATLANRWCDIAASRGLPAVDPEICGKFRVGDTRHCVSDSSMLTKAIGWEPRVTLEEGLPAVADWILENHFDVQLPVDHLDDVRAEMVAHGIER